jgi:hypothetical protein
MMKRKNKIVQFHVVGIAFLTCLLLAAFPFSKSVSAAEKETKVSGFSLTNDPFIDAQWYIDNQGHYTDLTEVMMRQKESTTDIDMDVPEAWKTMLDQDLPEREVVVAVIDTGVDYQHPDLADNMWINKDEIPGDNMDNDNNGYVDDVYGWDFYNNDASVCHYTYSERYNKYLASPEDNDNHGTHVAGIIAAVANNNTGIAGIASNIKIRIMSLKINGGKKGDGDVESAIEAIKYATMMGADICNLSWGTSVYSKGLEEAIRESDMLFVAAAGNTGADNDDKPIYPASLKLDNLISVTFVDADGDLTGYSNFGVESVDLAAPGDDIYSTIVGSYDSMSGSSMAAPQVTAIAALLYAYNDHLYAANVKNIIIGNIKKIDGLDNLIANGGIPSAYLAINAEGSLAEDTQAPIMSFSTIYNKSRLTVPVAVKDSGNSKVRVVKYIFGTKKVGDFKHGVIGTLIENGEADLSKAGTYTFFAADYAGNETAMTYIVDGDDEAPKLSMTYIVASNYKSRTVTATVSDNQSGIKRLEYMAGVKAAWEFLPADTGTEVPVENGKAKFKVKKDGVYTIFVTDYRGNVTVKTFLINTVKATEFSLTDSSRTLAPGDEFILRTYIRPVGSTDRIIYTSSNEKVAVVSSTGRVTALAEGKAYITATIASGISSTCVITVK